jgi:hypothetical protein
LPFNALGQVVFGPDPIVRFDQGMPFNAAGELVALNSGDDAFYGPGATAYGPNGELMGGVGGPDFYYQGVPYAASGGYSFQLAPGNNVVTKNFTLTIAQFAATSRGYRTSPLAGTLTPDLLFAGGTISIVQVSDDDTFRITPVGGVQFPGIVGDLSVIFGTARYILDWDINLYTTTVLGSYANSAPFIGVPTAMRLLGAAV